MLKQKLLSKFGPNPAGLSEKEQMRLALINMKLKDEDGDVHFVEWPLTVSSDDEIDATTSELGSGGMNTGRLAIGGVGTAIHLEKLESVGITHIVCLAQQVRTMFPDSFAYLRVDDFADDGSSQSLDIFRNQLEPCLRFIHDAITTGGSVLVHCYQGKSRSAAMCVAYLLRYFDQSQVPSLSSALGLIRRSRPRADPNLALMSVLREIENERGEHLVTSSDSTVFEKYPNIYKDC